MNSNIVDESVRYKKGSAITADALKLSTIHSDYTKNPVDVVAGVNIVCGKKRTNVFGGKFDRVKLGMYITKIIYSDPATIVFWSDDTKTMSKAQQGDVYSKETGLALCVLKKLVGGDQVAQLINDWVVQENYVDLKTIRTKHRTTKSKDKDMNPAVDTTVNKKKGKKLQK